MDIINKIMAMKLETFEDLNLMTSPFKIFEQH